MAGGGIAPRPSGSTDLIERYKRVAVATVYGGVREMGYMPCLILS